MRTERNGFRVKSNRQQCTDQQQLLHAKQSDLKKYESDSRTWIAEGITQLNQQQELLEKQRSESSQHQKQWEQKLNQSLAHRQEAEQITRDLLLRLELANSEEIQVPESNEPKTPTVSESK